MKRRLLSIGVPVRNEIENLPKLQNKIRDLEEELLKMGVYTEVIINDNASSDGSSEFVLDWAKKCSNVKAFHFESKISFQESILRLMKRANGEAFVVLQSDLQDPPEVILKFVKSWLTGSKLVVGVSRNRTERIAPNFFRKIFYAVLSRFSNSEMIPGFQDFFLLDKTVLSEIIRLPSQGLYLRGHLSSRFGNVEIVEYERNKRILGESKFNFEQKYSLALDGVLLFGNRILYFISVSSILVFFSSLILGIILLLLELFGIDFHARGWTSLALGLLIVTSLLSGMLALILEYLIRIYKLLIYRDNN